MPGPGGRLFVMSTHDAHVIYLVLCPHTPPAGRAQVAGGPPTLNKYQAPYFLDLDIELADLGQTERRVAGTTVQVRRQLIDEQIVAVECAYTLPDVLAPASNAHKQAIHTQLLADLRDEIGYSGPFLEEYTIVCLPGVTGSPDAFIEENQLALAALLRNVPRPMSAAEAEHVLVSRARYTDGDLTIVDWDGALLIDAAQDFRSDIELLKIGNYELLRYRLLDRAIERNLKWVREQLRARRRFNFFNGVVRDALEQRLELLLDFEKTEQLLLLIGDWYSSQLYRLIVDEFYIDEWKATVKIKLDQLESITDVIRENFSVNWQQTLDMVQVVGWLILLTGYFVLFYFDVGRTFH
jgi:hypothetical protein